MAKRATDPTPPDPTSPRDAIPHGSRREPGSAGARGSWLAIVRAVGRGFGALSRPIAAAAALGWMAGIWWLSSGPIGIRTPLPVGDFFSNLAHAPVFGVLAALVAAAAAPRPLPAAWPRPGRTACFVALLVVALWAGIDELHQGRVHGRHGSPFDFATDLTGSAAVLWVASYAGRREAHERGMRGRLAVAIALCAAVAAVTTVADRFGAS